jgi:hypothetical protein
VFNQRPVHSHGNGRGHGVVLVSVSVLVLVLMWGAAAEQQCVVVMWYYRYL